MVWLESMFLLNYKPVLHQPTGIGVYANAVLPALQNLEHAIIPGGGSGGAKERLRRFAWSQFQLPKLARERKADLIFTPAPEGYLGHQLVPQVVMVHDLRPLSHPERSMQSLYFRLWVPLLLTQCRHILTNSNFTASEICRSIGIPQDKISVTPLGYDQSRFYPADHYRRMHHRPYLMHIGQAYPHKNLYRLIQAFDAITSRFPEVDLLLLGKPHPTETARLRTLVLELGLSRRVIFKNYVSYDELPDWYRGAKAFVYPSLWEGFGLPILEAMACGCPVLTSFGSATEEVASIGNELLINPHSTSDIVEALCYVLAAQDTRRTNNSALTNKLAKYTWAATQQQTAGIMESILT